MVSEKLICFFWNAKYLGHEVVMLFFLLLSTGCEGKARIFFVFHPASGIFKNLFINCVCAVLIFRCYLYMYIFSNVLHASLFFVLFFLTCIQFSLTYLCGAFSLQVPLKSDLSVFIVVFIAFCF